MSNTKHTPGPWSFDGFDTVVCENRARVALLDRHTLGKEAAERNGDLIAAAPELLAELKAANQIIKNALNLMTDMQKEEWSRANARDRVHGEGVTRRYERDTAIARAESR